MAKTIIIIRCIYRGRNRENEHYVEIPEAKGQSARQFAINVAKKEETVLGKYLNRKVFLRRYNVGDTIFFRVSTLKELCESGRRIFICQECRDLQDCSTITKAFESCRVKDCEGYYDELTDALLEVILNKITTPESDNTGAIESAPE